MIWLFMGAWLNTQSPRDYKIVAKVGPFNTYEQCWSAGALSANAIQSKDEITNALGACVTQWALGHYVRQPSFIEFKSMWDMVCASMDKADLCWLQDGHFIDPMK